MRSICLFLLCFFLINKTTNAQNHTSTEDLKILSWNIHMLPYFVYHKTKKQKRAKSIIEELSKSDYNIIVFQEAFHAFVRKKIWKHLKEKFPYEYGPANKRFLSLKANSGIWILCDRPMIYKNEIQYKHYTGDGRLARKGALLLEGEHNGHLFQVLGTHNNGGSINNSQFLEIRALLLDPYKKAGVPQFICGDFNTSKSSANNQYQTMIRLFDANEAYVQSDERNETDKKSIPAEKGIYYRFPDFIFVRNNDNDKVNINRLSTISMGPSWKQGSKKIYGETVGLSDHFPVMISINWKE